MKLLENDVMEEMLEEYYASENQVFFDFVDAYGTGRDDTKIVDIILKLYRFARSYPWPEEWFKDCLCIYRQADIDTAEQNAAIGYLFDTVRRRFKDYDRQYQKLESICNEPDGPLMYAAAVQSDHAGSVRFWIRRVMKNWCVKCACCLLKRLEEAAVRIFQR